MNGKFVVVTFVALLLTTAGCEKKSVSLPAPRALQSNFLKVAFAASPQHFIAESHNLEVITPESELQKSWESAIAFCGTIRCEVVSSSITTRVSDSEPTGAISLRVVPEDLNKLLADIERLGKIAEHTTQREDKTAEVVDADARLKNLTSFRDNLRAMLARPSAKVADLVEIQQQLTDTQTQLDSESALRKILANETEKIAVEISFRVERPNVGSGGFAEIWTTLRESDSVLADSTASLITVIVTVIPWLILIVPGVWFLRRVWRNLRRNRSRATPPPSAAS
ncbi:MAG TPA: DUF4349 domain-containing protein [Candidatus Acidoferrales bacterium]|nr:DUF4349 domain-containing protein [Candidatus Acidoferrales bacterium]